MALVPIEDVGSYGIITDTSGHRLPLSAWSDGENIRFVDGHVEKFTGFASVLSTPSVAPFWLQPWQQITGASWMYASAAKMYTVAGATHTDITRYTATPGDNDYTAGTLPVWTGGILHGVPIANHNNLTDPPQQWDSALSRMKDLANWPASTFAKVVRPYKNFLIALDITESGTRFPHMIRWSHPADPGSVPVSWDYTDATRLAGRHTISQSDGWVIDCAPLGNLNIIYKSDAIWGMQPINSPEVFAFGELSSTTGLLGPRAIAVFNKIHFAVGRNDIYTFDGSRVQSVLSKKRKKWFFSNLNVNFFENVVVVPNLTTKEIWVGFPSVDSVNGYLDKALIWNWEDNTVTTRSLPETSHFAFGNIGTVSNTFDAAVGSFDSQSETFGSATAVPSAYYLVFGKPTATFDLIQAESGFTDRGTNYTSFIERTGLTVVGTGRDGAPRTDEGSIKMLTRLYPKITANASTAFKISVGSQERADGPVTWEGPYDFDPTVDEYVDYAVEGRFLAVRFEETSDVSWKLHGYTVDVHIVSNI